MGPVNDERQQESEAHRLKGFIVLFIIEPIP
jgi:hypothetical protein